MRQRLFTWIRERFAAPSAPPTILTKTSAPAAFLPARVVMPPAAPPRPSPPPPVAAPVKFNSAVELLQSQPNLSAADLVQRAGVTMSYARRLIRQQKMKAAAASRRPAKAEAPPPAPVVPAPTRKWTRPAQDIPVQPMLLTPRTQVLDRNASGVAMATIAEDLKLPQDEVDFILKVGRIKNTLKN